MIRIKRMRGKKDKTARFRLYWVEGGKVEGLPDMSGQMADDVKGFIQEGYSPKYALRLAKRGYGE